MKKMIILFLVWGICVLTSFSQVNFKGGWYIDGGWYDFSLNINQINNTIIGNHCGTAYQGQFIDCSVGYDGNTINGIVQGDSALITFFSTYCNQTGNAVIKKISPTQIQWRVTKKPGGTLYLPLNVVMNLEVDPCSLTMLPGFNYLTNSISNDGGYAMFYFVFWPSSYMSVGTSYRVATVSENCRPAVARQMSFTTGGNTWSVTVNPNGDVYAKIVSGSGISGSPYPTNNVVSLGTLVYNF